MPLKFDSNSPKQIVFCDFDGTITAVETFAEMLKAFAPDLSAKLLPEMYAKRLTLREGVRKILEAIPSARYPEMIDYVEHQPTRPGLDELVDFLDVRGIPIHIISGGLREMVEKVLSRQNEGKKPLIERVASISAMEIDTSGDYLRVHSEFEGDTELVAKVWVMAKYPAAEQIAIGDSLTDINMALQADVVFARDRLVKYLDAENQPYIPWRDFFDVRNALSERIPQQR